MRKKLLSLLVLLMAITANATVRTVTYQLSVDGKTINKDGVTCTNSFDSYNNMDEGTFSVSSGNFTQIVVNANDVISINLDHSHNTIPGWTVSGKTATWTGSASSVNFGSIMGNNRDVTIVFTIDDPTVNLTANAGDATGEYWATYYDSAQGYTADANTTVYQAKVNGTTTGVVLTEVTSKEIPAGKGVVLKSSSSTITLTPATTTATYSDNQLLGTDVALATPANAYCLSKETSGKARGVGFYLYTPSDGATIPAHRAYLVVAGGPSTARGFLGFDDDDNTTGIGLPEAVVVEGDGPVYDLSGRLVTGQPQKGVYVKNGKKVVIK
jgi:hypothetical protein